MRPAVAAILEKEAIRPIQKEAALRGIADKMVVYEIPVSAESSWPGIAVRSSSSLPWLDARASTSLLAL